MRQDYRGRTGTQAIRMSQAVLLNRKVYVDGEEGPWWASHFAKPIVAMLNNALTQAMSLARGRLPDEFELYFRYDSQRSAVSINANCRQCGTHVTLAANHRGELAIETMSISAPEIGRELVTAPGLQCVDCRKLHEMSIQGRLVG